MNFENGALSVHVTQEGSGKRMSIAAKANYAWEGELAFMTPKLGVTEK